MGPTVPEVCYRAQEMEGWPCVGQGMEWREEVVVGGKEEVVEQRGAKAHLFTERN